LHHTNHDRLEAILRRMVERAIARADVAGAAVDVIALAAVRATREAGVRRGGGTLPRIIGMPGPGEPTRSTKRESPPPPHPPPSPSLPSSASGGGLWRGTGEGREGVFDGLTEVAVFPGEFPDDPDALFAPGAAPFRGLAAASAEEADFRFVRFRPPPLESIG